MTAIFLGLNVLKKSFQMLAIIMASEKPQMFL